MSKRNKRPISEIPTEFKVNLTTSMRLQLAKEIFDNEGTPNVLQSLSVCSTQSDDELPCIHLRPELNENITYENDIISVCDCTVGTISYESIKVVGEQSTLEEKKNKKIKCLKAKKFQLQQMEIKMDEVVEQKDFLKEEMPGFFDEILWTRGEAEMHFVQGLINDINNLIAGSGRTDIVLQSSTEFETNCLPILKIRLRKKTNSAPTDHDLRKKLEVEENCLRRPSFSPCFLFPLHKIIQVINSGLQVASLF